MVEQLRQDIRDFKAANNCERVVVLWAASTEIITSRQDRQRRRVKILLGVLIIAATALALFWFFVLR